jgi:FMN phosphatase YigB (HAD superfamily)
MDDTLFLFDVDNTLLDNDRFGVDLGAIIEQRFGAAERARYWSIFEQMRNDTQVADYLGALQRMRTGLEDDPQLLTVGHALLEYPYTERLYPGALDTLRHANTLGRAAILSDGDIVFQPRKIERSGIWAAVEGRVMICVHKEKVLDHMQARFPAGHYVMVDDKAYILAAMKKVLGDSVTTVFVRQGHYASAPQSLAAQPAPDVAIDVLGDFRQLKFNDIKAGT